MEWPTSSYSRNSSRKKKKKRFTGKREQSSKSPPKNVEQDVPLAALALGPGPVTVRCPHCRRIVRTIVHSQFTAMQHLLSLIMCMVGCCFCSCLPYLISDMYHYRHFCPNCLAFLGMFSP